MQRASVLFWVAGVPAFYGALQLAEIRNPIVMYAVIGGVLALAVVAHHRQMLRRPTHLSFLAFFSALLIASLMSSLRATPGEAYRQVVLLSTCLLWCGVFVALYFAIRTRSELGRATRLLERVGVGVSASVFLSYLLPRYSGIHFGELVDTEWEVRAFGPFGDQVGFVSALFALTSIATRRFMLTPLHVGAFLFTGTRGATATFLAGFVWMMLFAPLASWRAHRIRNLTASAAALVVVVVLFLATPQGQNLYARYTIGTGSARTMRHRSGAMAAALRMFADHPIVGVGFLGFNRIVGEYGVGVSFEEGEDEARATFTAQNQYLQTATDAGAFGLIALATLLWSSWRRFRAPGTEGETELDPTFAGYQAWIAGMLVGNVASVWLLPSATSGYFFFVVLALADRRCAIAASAEEAFRST